MALTPEIKERLSNPSERDSAMFDLMVELIREPSCSTEEMIRTSVGLPVLNELSEQQIHEVLLRVHFANQILPQIREEFASWLSAFLIPGAERLDFNNIVSGISDSGTRTTMITICHIMVSQAEVIAEKFQTPKRETYAAIARAASQMAIKILVESDDEDLKRYAKTNLVYFATLEMLAIGVKTGSYQFGFVNPKDATTESFPRQELISPVIALHPGEDEKRFKADLVLGGKKVDGRIKPLPGMEFFYLSQPDGSEE